MPETPNSFEEKYPAIAELAALDELIQLGRGAVEMSLTEDGNVGIYWTGREGCGLTGDSVEDCLTGRYFQNEVHMQTRARLANA